MTLAQLIIVGLSGGAMIALLVAAVWVARESEKMEAKRKAEGKPSYWL